MVEADQTATTLTVGPVHGELAALTIGARLAVADA
jgi:hypothetical protein